jgi:hypothetical protein
MPLLTAKRSHSVYVVELDLSILDNKKFIKKHPEYVNLRQGKRCFYVGMTGLTPEERFANHKKGHKCCRFVRDYGLYLRHKMFKELNPMTLEKARKKEVDLAQEIRAKGHVVHQN